MKKTLFFAFFFLVFNTSFAQKNIEIEFGSIFKNEKRQIPIDIIAQDKNGYYILYSEGKYGEGDDMYLRKFNLDLTPSDKEINLKSDTYEGKFNSLGLAKIKDNITHIFYLLTDEGKTYYYQNIDLETFSLSDRNIIATIKNDVKKAKNSLSKFIIADDENTITLFYTIPNKRRDAAKIKIQTFDSNFVEIKNNIYELPYNNDVISIKRIFQNTKGELFLLYKKYDSYKTISDENFHRYEFQLYKIQEEKLTLLNTIRPKDVHLRTLNTTLINETELILTGLFSKKNMYAMSGIYTSKIDLNKGLVQYSKYNKLSSNFFSKLMTDGKKKDKAIKKYKEGKREDPNYILQQTIALDNNEILLLAEQIWSYSYNYAITYYHHNIAAIKLDSNGNIIWANKIGKRNDKPNVPIYSSYYPVYKNSKIHFLYNCSARNLNHKKGKLANYFSDHTDKAFISNNLNLDSGNYKRQILINHDQLQNITIRPQLYNWVNDNTLLMFGQDISNLKNQRFVKLIFNE